MKHRYIPIVALCALVLIALTPAGAADAQTPPTRLFGALTIDGNPAPAGTVVKAIVNGMECNTSTTTNDGRYVLDVHSAATLAGCGADNDMITILVNDVPADQTATFATGAFVALDLNASSAGATPPPPPSDNPPPPPADTPPGDTPPPPADMPPAE